MGIQFADGMLAQQVRRQPEAGSWGEAQRGEGEGAGALLASMPPRASHEEKPETETVCVGVGGLSKAVNTFEPDSPLREHLLPPLPRNTRQSGDAESQGEKRSSGSILLRHYSPRHPHNPSFLFFKISQDEIFPQMLQRFQEDQREQPNS